MMSINIAFFLKKPNDIGGTEIVTRYLTNEMIHHHQIVIFCLCYDDLGYYDDRISIIPIFKDRERIIFEKIDKLLLNKFLFGFLSSLMILISLRNKIKSYSIDYFVNQDLDYTSMFSFLNKYCKIVLVLHWSLFDYLKIQYVNKENSRFGLIYSFIRYMKENIIKNRLRRYHKVVTLVENAKQNLLDWVKIDPQKIVVIPNPLPYNNSSKDTAQFLNKNVLFVGRLAEEKGVDLLLDIWSEFEKNTNDISTNLIIIGGGPRLEEFKSLARSLNLKRVVFKGEIKDIVLLNNYYKMAKLLLMTSRTEGFGLVLIEAMHFGIPSIAFDVPLSPREVIGEAGVLISPYNIKEYCMSMNNILNDSNYWSLLSTKALNRSEFFYSQYIVKNWEKEVFI